MFEYVLEKLSACMSVHMAEYREKNIILSTGLCVRSKMSGIGQNGVY